ncbi:ABC transporter ATPase [Flagellimonas aequoris]|uniref:ABC transporter ATPase n=1 Tax=Flagellimonas aequoris TaxID=2306997 RepID=A0A418NDK5_9FLAO|nr:ABC transporter ATPase [Allomuricauda aequoris]RIV74416.1 ABC transporter ATPase [Allomuricauda aequoris]TXK08538.1 ABC transporter ATPase [Allomuricauda aequoris]
MLVEFNELPNHSRIWIYQSNRSFTESELQDIQQSVSEFLKQWTAHGSDLHAGFEMKYNRFIIIGLDQTNASASGCSIDASVHFMQTLEQKFQVELMDRMNVSFKQGEYIAYKPLTDFKKMAKDKAVSANTIVFNNLVATKQEYLENWEVPASESWHSRFV